MALSREDILSADRAHVWRPYTSSEDHELRDPIVTARAEGVFLYDVNGKRYFDGNGSWWCNNLGHGHPRIKAAIHEQVETLMHCAMADITHEQAALLAAELTATAPAGLSRVFYSDDGSTAVEVAVKMAFQYFAQNGQASRRRFVSLAGAFHGDTIGAVSVGDVPEFHRLFGPLLFEVEKAPEPSEQAGWEQAVDAIERRLLEHPSEYAAVIVEPLVQGAVGMRMWPAPLLRRLREVTKQVGALLIADEVFTGFGRTGPMWACEHAEISPDILCTAKGFSGGVLPFAATLATESIFDGFRGGKTRAFMHGHTFYGNPMGARVAREVLAIYRDEGTLLHARDRADELAVSMAELAELPGVHRTRSLGMVAAADLGEGGYYGQVGWRVHEHAKSLGAYIRPLGNTVYLVPSLNITADELADLLQILRRSVQAAVSGAS